MGYVLLGEQNKTREPVRPTDLLNVVETGRQSYTYTSAVITIAPTSFQRRKIRAIYIVGKCNAGFWPVYDGSMPAVPGNDPVHRNAVKLRGTSQTAQFAHKRGNLLCSGSLYLGITGIAEVENETAQAAGKAAKGEHIPMRLEESPNLCLFPACGTTDPAMRLILQICNCDPPGVV